VPLRLRGDLDLREELGEPAMTFADLLERALGRGDCAQGRNRGRSQGEGEG